MRSHLKQTPHRFPFRGPKNVCRPSRNSHFFETIDLQNFYPDHDFYTQDVDGCWMGMDQYLLIPFLGE